MDGGCGGDFSGGGCSSGGGGGGGCGFSSGGGGTDFGGGGFSSGGGGTDFGGGGFSSSGGGCGSSNCGGTDIGGPPLPNYCGGSGYSMTGFGYTGSNFSHQQNPSYTPRSAWATQQPRNYGRNNVTYLGGMPTVQQPYNRNNPNGLKVLFASFCVIFIVLCVAIPIVLVVTLSSKS